MYLINQFLQVVILAIQVVSLSNGAFAQASEAKNKGVSMSTVRTYMNYPDNIDPAHILTMADLELAISLSSTLVTFDEKRSLIAGLAKSWTTENGKLSFTLRDNLKWSSGDKITAEQYRQSLLRAKKLYPNDLKSLFDSIDKIEALDETTVVITTKEKVTASEIILKLSESMYGLVAIDSSGNLDLSKSSGPFVYEKKDDQQLTLKSNHNWFLYNSEMPEKIELKRPNMNLDLLSGFHDDKWANLVIGHSIVKSETLNSFKKDGYKIWQRADDKLFALYPSKKFTHQGGTEVIKLIRKSQKMNELVRGLSGYSQAEQFFPRGYSLWSSANPKIAEAKIKNYKEAIKVIVPESYMAIPTKERLPKIISEATGSNHVVVEIVALSKINERMKAQDYDILATGIAVADPNFEGALSFFIEREPPFIASGVAPYDYANQLKSARSLKSASERAEAMKNIILKTQESGYVLPVFHFSSIAVAKGGVDISEITNSDETIHFSKVRIK